jgi:small membrane protein
MLILFQILFILFSVAAIFLILKKNIGPKSMFFWIIFWLMADVAVLWPNSTTIVANAFGIGRGTDFVLYLAVVLIFYLLFRMNVKMEMIGRDVTKVVRKNTLEKEIDRNSKKY